MTSAWPFLIARGRLRDYRTVLLPGVLTDPAAASALADALPIGEPGGAPRTTTVDERRLGALRVTAQTAVLSPDDVGSPPGSAPFVTDDHGRPLVYLFGLLSAAGAAGRPDERHLALARDDALRAYREFLADEAGFQPVRSGPVDVPSAAAPTATAPRSHRGPAAGPTTPRSVLPSGPSRAPHRGPKPRVLVGLAVALVLLVVAVLALRPGGSSLQDLRVAVGPAEPRPPACSDLRLSVTVTLAEEQVVTFRWTSDDGETSAAAQRRLRPGTQTVELRPRLPVDDAEPDQSGVLTVTAEAGDGTSASAPVEYRCTAG
jgi:hypothetical protein